MNNQLRSSNLARAMCLLTAVLCGCGAFGDDTPADVIKSTYMAANSGRYSDAESHLPAEWVKLTKLPGSVLGSEMKKVWDSKTHNRTIERIEILEEEKNDVSADVRFRLHFKGGQTEEDAIRLLKEDGKWKLQL